jgi:hypothetical protein
VGGTRGESGGREEANGRRRMDADIYNASAFSGNKAILKISSKRINLFNLFNSNVGIILISLKKQEGRKSTLQSRPRKVTSERRMSRNKAP